MSQDPAYLKIPALAKYLGISEKQARELAKSKRLRSIKGAVIDVNMSKNKKKEVLSVNVQAAVKAYSAMF